MSAPEELPVIKNPNLADVEMRVRAASFDTGRDCEHCAGSGVVRDGTNRIVHSRAGFIGCDWPLDAVLEAVADAKQVAWGPGFIGHDLAVQMADGSWMKFDVPHPGRDQRAAES